MNYGLPYKGSKNRIAKKILDVLPAAPVLYDVFCGGCAITHAALLSGKYSRVVANDINGMIPHAFEKAIQGGFRNEDRWISRDDFQRLYKTDPYVAICFSFGNNLQEYCYARALEPYKRALHYAIFWKDIVPWAELCPETADALAAGLAPIEDRKQRRVQAGHFIVESLKAQLAAEMLRPDILDKPIYRQIRKVKDTPHSLQSLESLRSLESFERLKSLETLEHDERLQRLESLERITDVDVSPVLTVTTGDYRALTFEQGGIIYCDPPYKNTGQYRTVGTFDFDAFYSWCEAQTLPVYISEYSMPEDRFVPVAAFTVTRKLSAKKSNICPEKIWRPRTQL